MFPPQALDEAEAIAQRTITPEELGSREDLRNELIFTIDGEDAKDLDDAISVKRTETGWSVGVHIADVSHYVTPGSALDAEALRRGTSVYFADRVVPMLPEAISNGVCSLGAGEDKLTFSALLEVNKNGELCAYRFCKSVIRSKVRGVYAQVNRLFDNTADEATKEKYRPIFSSLMEARELAHILRERARSRGMVELESRESRFVLDENGVCTDMYARSSGEAEQLIEQLMILANQAAAKLAKESKIPFVYRVHEEPSPQRLEALKEMASWMGFETRTVKPGLRPEALARLHEQAKKTKYARIVSYQILRTMAKARYDVRPIGHYGLALSDYCHFTSPIRRYPDTSIHRILSALVGGQSAAKLSRSYAAFAELSAAQSTECEMRAMNAERSAEACYAAEYMRSHLGEVFEGVISGVTEWGVYVELENTAEGFIRAEHLPGRYEFDGVLTYTNRFGGDTLTIGDRMRVKAVRQTFLLGKLILCRRNRSKRNGAD